VALGGVAGCTVALAQPVINPSAAINNVSRLSMVVSCKWQT
jgi:hypothetical protein